jgi:pyruvate-formate lyase-activating enzyme
MKYKCCKHLHNSLCFNLNQIRTCNDLHTGEELYNYEDNIAPNIEEIWTKRKQIIEDCKRGIFPKNCQTCPNLEEAEWDDDIRIKKLSLFHWLHCNCDCEYCFQKNLRKRYTDEIMKSSYYDAYPLLEYMYDNNLMSDCDDLWVEFGGGEVTILKEFPDLLNKILIKNKLLHCVIMSSGILYSEDIQRALENEKVKFSVTISAGNRETFKKIKNRDKFDIVKANLAKYIDKAPYKENITIRYILDEGYNDNEKDLQDWLKTCNDIKAHSIQISLDFCRGFNNKSGEPYSPHLEKLIQYYLKEAPKLTVAKNISVDLTSQDILDRGHY